MTRTRIGLALATALVGGAGLLGLAACGPAADAVNLSAEGQALTAIGYNAADLQAAPAEDPGPAASAGPAPSGSAAPGADGKAGTAADGARRRALGRALLRRNTLHAEAVVRTKDGVKTVDVQRGTVTAMDDRTVTVKSSDGFTLTWTLGNPVHVVEHRTAVQPSVIKVGTEIGVAGVKDGDATTARLIVIQVRK
jgi:hypothetical protein